MPARINPLLLWCLGACGIGCTDYGYQGKPAEPGEGSDSATDTGWDTAAPIVDSGGAGGVPGPDGTPDSPDTAGRPDTGHPDTGHPSDDTGPDTATVDTCYEPEDGYSTNPAARIFTTDSATKVTVTFIESRPPDLPPR